MIREDVRVLLEDGGAGPRLEQSSLDELEDQRGCVVLALESGELQNAGVKNDFQGRARRDG